MDGILSAARKRVATFSAAAVSSYLILASVAIGTFSPLAIPVAQASAAVTPASGGSSIDSSTVGGAYTSLTGPVITEGAVADIEGPNKTIILNIPGGFEFDTTANSVTATVTTAGSCSGGANKPLKLGTSGGGASSQTVTPTTTAITINIKSESDGAAACASIVTFSGIKVRPTAASPLASGNITKSGTSTIAGVSGSTNFGTLTETETDTDGDGIADITDGSRLVERVFSEKFQ